MPDSKPRGQTITVAQAAALLGRSERWVQGLVKSGYNHNPVWVPVRVRKSSKAKPHIAQGICSPRISSKSRSNSPSAGANCSSSTPRNRSGHGPSRCENTIRSDRSCEGFLGEVRGLCGVRSVGAHLASQEMFLPSNIREPHWIETHSGWRRGRERDPRWR